MLTLRSPAKINLYLKVLGRRSDGYHNLETMMQTISLFDQISYTLSDRDQLTCDTKDIPLDSSNLIFKAIELFRTKTGYDFKIDVKLHKKIPIQAGLGGGSSNAATTLWALNQLLGLPVSHQDLIQWSGEIGSDITFFLSCGRALCTSRGEKIENINTDEEKSLWIIKPPLGLSTKKVFENYCPSNQRVSYKYYNHLEKTAFQLSEDLIFIKNDLLNQGFEHVVMSGAGTSFFCEGDVIPNLPEKTFCEKVNFIYRLNDHWY